MTTSVGLRAGHMAAEMGGHYHTGQGPEKWKQHRLGERRKPFAKEPLRGGQQHGAFGAELGKARDVKRTGLEASCMSMRAGDTLRTQINRKEDSLSRGSTVALPRLLQMDPDSMLANR